jgi:hypothetical protein
MVTQSQAYCTSLDDILQSPQIFFATKRHKNKLKSNKPQYMPAALLHVKPRDHKTAACNITTEK